MRGFLIQAGYAGLGEKFFGFMFHALCSRAKYVKSCSTTASTSWLWEIAAASRASESPLRKMKDQGHFAFRAAQDFPASAAGSAGEVTKPV
jgi:hypothetical protein